LAGQDKMHPKLLQAYELIRSVLEDGDNQGTQIQSHWDFPMMAPPDGQGFMSATDLLTWWFRAPADGPNPWDVYFRNPDTSPAGNASAGRKEGPDLSFPFRENFAPFGQQANMPSELLRKFVPDQEERLDDTEADRVADCLYGFIHALGRRDVEGGMQFIDNEYHVLENDREVDCLGLRHQCESLLDSLRGWEIDISLAEIPEPVLHPNGVLVLCKIQIDAHNPAREAHQSRLEKRLAVFRKNETGEWRIHALSPLND